MADMLTMQSIDKPLMKSIKYKIINGNINVTITYDTATPEGEKTVVIIPDHIYKVTYYDNIKEIPVTFTGRLDLILSNIEEMETSLQTGSTSEIMLRFDASTIYNGELKDIKLLYIRYIEEVLQ